MKTFLVIIILFLLIVIGLLISGKVDVSFFKLNQKSERTVSKVVHKPGTKVETRLRNLFLQNNLLYPPQRISLYAIKKDKVLEVWTEEQDSWKLVHRYPILAASGKLGPKLREGDKQVPEGIYKITELNPNSSFHLSMRINYPNPFDLKYANLEKRNNPGGDIYIHGESQSIGCIAIGNKSIEELYLLAHIVGIDNMKVIITPTDPIEGKLIPPEGAPVWVSELYKNIENHSYKFGRKPKLWRLFDEWKTKLNLEKIRDLDLNRLIIAAILISFLTIILNFWIYFKNRKIKFENTENQSLVLLAQYQSDLRNWSERVISKMTETALMCDLDPDKNNDLYSKRHNLRVSLSSLSDSGKIFIPGKDRKIRGFNGLRDLPLELIEECYNLAGQINCETQGDNSILRERIIDCKNKFVQELAEELNS